MASGFDYDLFVIGAGSGGVRAARVAAQAGARVGIAEEYRIGGTCVIRGCVPKKFLVMAADYGRAFAEAEDFGWSVTAPPRFDWSVLTANIHREVDRLSAIYARNLAAAGVETFEERAEFEGPETVRLLRSGRVVRAAKILVATGGRPWRPLSLPGQELAITSEEAFLLPALPKRVVIAGGGYIALEFACIFNGLGADVTLLYRGDKLLRGFDEDVRDQVQSELLRLGVTLKFQTVFGAIEKTDAGLLAHLANGETLGADHIMLAIGRTPHTRGLGLEKAGVEVDENGAVIVDAFSRTSAENVWAVGDVTNRLNLTPVAIREGQCFAATEFGGQKQHFDHADVASAVFSRPPVGVVGLSEAEARAKFGAVDIYRTRFRPMRFSLGANGERMLIKLIVRRDDQAVVGCHIVGADAPEMIQLAAIAVKAGLTKAQWDATCAVHPTAAEELVTLREKAPD